MTPIPSTTLPAPAPANSPAAQSKISAERVKQAVRARFNPIAGLTPESLARQLEEFRTGGLGVARTWEAIKQRWPILKSVSDKREKAVARLDWDVLIREELPEEQKTEAEKQRDVLKEFYNRLRATTVLKQDERGGVALLLRQMMQAVGYGHSVHEIVWTPRGDGSLGAEFRHCPLWFFEARSGKLKFLPQEFAIEGEPLDPAKWLVTCGDGLMEASSVSYVYRDLPLKDWLALSEKYGIPFLQGITDAQPGSPEWAAAETALANFTGDGSILTSRGVEIKPIEVSVNGQTVSAPLVAKMDQYAIILWRGGDLSTQSSDPNSTGASLQGEEADVLLEDDAANLSETLNEQVDLFVLRYAFGPNVEPLAYFSVAPPKKANVDADLKIDDFFLKNKIPLGVDAAYERYGRTAPADDEEIIVGGQSQAATTSPEEQQRLAGDAADARGVLDVLANEADTALVREGLREVSDVLHSRLRPLRTQLERIAAIDDPAAQRRAVEDLRGALKDLIPIRRGGPADELQQAFSKLLGTGMVQGLSA